MPVLLLVESKIVKNIPGVKAAVMAVVEYQLNGIAADGFDGGYVDVFLSGLKNFLPRSVATHLRRGRVNTQILAGQLAMKTVLEPDLKNA
jgi:hypothetical protein